MINLKERNLDIITSWRAGKSDKEIAKKYNITVGRVRLQIEREILKSAGKTIHGA